MTTKAALRYQRRAERAARERQERTEAVKAALFGLLILLAFLLAGTADYQEEQRQIAYWADRGVTVSRGW